MSRKNSPSLLCIVLLCFALLCFAWGGGGSLNRLDRLQCFIQEAIRTKAFYRNIYLDELVCQLCTHTYVHLHGNSQIMVPMYRVNAKITNFIDVLLLLSLRLTDEGRMINYCFKSKIQNK